MCLSVIEVTETVEFHKKSHGYLHAELQVEPGASISKSSPLFWVAAVCQDTSALPKSFRTKKKKKNLQAVHVKFPIKKKSY